MAKYKYEALWCKIGTDDYESKEFNTKQAVLNFYNKHKDDSDKTGWWVTKRHTDDWSVAEDIIY